MEDLRKGVLTAVTDHYLESSEFNGIPPDELAESLGVTIENVQDALHQLIEDGMVSLNAVGNFHIKAFQELPVEQQLKHLDEINLRYSCVYPTAKYLKKVVEPKDYEGRPYSLRLALGEPQLKPIFFDLVILETYRNDPRMRYWLNDIGGSIWITDKACEAGQAEERDKVFLKSFGFGYDSDMNRVVAVFLWDLSVLTPEHQRIWETKELSGSFSLHPDYYRTQILGEFPERWSLCEAFILEIKTINDMTQAMDRPPLFKKVYDSASRPREFTLMIRPTQKELNAFVHLLDKLLSENLNKEFFDPDIDLEEEISRGDGKVEVRQKGTLRLLEEWLRKKVRFKDDKPFVEMIATFKKIRKVRQKPAHLVDEDEFDQRYFKEQRELLVEAYNAIRTLRLVFANDPRVSSVKVDQALYEGKIWAY